MGGSLAHVVDAVKALLLQLLPLDYGLLNGHSQRVDHLLGLVIVMGNVNMTSI